MQYEPMTVGAPRSKSELLKSYNRVRNTFHGDEAVLRERANNDAADLRALHKVVGKQLAEIETLSKDIISFQAHIDRLRAKLKEQKIEIREIDRSMPVDTALFDVPRIVRAVAMVHGVDAEQIKGARRDKGTVVARFHVMGLLARHRPDLSLPQIGRLFGNRNHATIMNARDKWERMKWDYPTHVVAVERVLGISETE